MGKIRYLQRQFIYTEIELAMEYLVSLKPDSVTLRPSLTEYLANFHPYNSRAIDQASRAWWNAGRRLGFDNDLASIAEDLIACICNSAKLERAFSTMRATYGDLHTSLGIEKNGKLTFLHRKFNVNN